VGKKRQGKIIFEVTFLDELSVVLQELKLLNDFTVVNQVAGGVPFVFIHELVYGVDDLVEAFQLVSLGQFVLESSEDF